MEKIIELSADKGIENITNEDWPLLNELENTRFSLKNKKGRRKHLSTIKEETEAEDKLIEAQSAEDEILVETFLETVSNKNFEKNGSVVIKSEEFLPREILVSSFADNVQVKDESKAIEKVSVQAPVVPVPKIEERKFVSVSTRQEEESVDKDAVKLIAVGMAKIYINKTDTILNPLRFILRNGLQISIALIQFIVPSLITWYLINNVPSVSAELAKESTLTYGLYVFIFYFACMFLWITSQVIAAGLWNMLKYAKTTLLKAGKN